MEIKQNNLLALEQNVHAALSRGNLDDALKLVKDYVEIILFDASPSPLTLSSESCDALCSEIAHYASAKFNLTHSNTKETSSVFVLSELIAAGGHVELLKDYLMSGQFLNQSIIITDIFCRQNMEDVLKFSKDFKVDIYVQSSGNYEDKLLEISEILSKKNPDKIILLNHHQDVVAIIGALINKNSGRYFIHHADHNLALGVTCQDFLHIDIHSMGFWCCRENLKLKNSYWPMVVRDSFQNNPYRPLVTKNLVTCSSGRFEKFISNGYIYDYFSLLPKIILSTGGSHVHIGTLSTEALLNIENSLHQMGINKERFIHVPWVPSVAKALVDLHVDLYLPSFPVGGGKACLEAMSAGIPLFMHHNYSSRLLSGVDLSYADVLIWKNENDLLSTLKNITVEQLRKFSEKSRNHYLSNYSQEILNQAIKSNHDNLVLVPELREYEIDEAQIRLDRESFSRETIQKLNKEIRRVNQEWLTATSIIDSIQQQVLERDQSINNLSQQVLERDQSINNLSQQINLIVSSVSWKITKPMRKIKQYLKSIIRKVPGTKIPVQKLKNLLAFKTDINKSFKNFDKAFYLAMYPDIAATGVDPLEHFVLHGKSEGRLGEAPKAIQRGSFVDFDESLETVIVVSHEATVTGAPILAMNIANELSKRYNVIVILLGPGSLVERFNKKRIISVLSSEVRGSELLAEYLLAELLTGKKVKFAIVNTIESAVMLPALVKMGIPTVSLIHEFASSVKNKDKFKKICFWSERVVFSSQITIDNMLEELPVLQGVSVNILAQGKSSLPLNSNSQILEKSRHQLINFINSQGKDQILLIGIGTIYYRKGVDLFIQTASYIEELKLVGNFKYIWIGKNVDQELGTDYSSYLTDQIKRSNLQNKVFFFEEMSDIEFVYQAADVLLLTSRLDPLPNVAIDALVHGLPVLCFENASGISEILESEGLGESCVASFLNTKELAKKVIDLCSSEELMKSVKDQCRNLGSARFNMSHYVVELEQIALSALTAQKQFLEDVAEIKNSGLFRFDYATASHWKGLSQDDIIAAYVRGWRTGIDLRKPMPGFHPGIYKEKHGVSHLNGDPFADFIRTGCPPGPWSTQVLSVTNEEIKSVPDDFKVALHIHVFYPQLLYQILKRLSVNKIRPDLFISVPSLEAKLEVDNILLTYTGKIGAIEIVPNKGRDIGPLLTLFGEELINSYDIIGHIHTKVSPHVADEVGSAWSHFLYENILGGESGPAADSILLAMYEHPELGLAFPDDPHPIGWDKNLNDAMYLADRLQLTEPLEKNFNFPVGTMFWARKYQLRKLIQLGMTWSDYPEEPLPIDGTILHAIERMLPNIEPEMKNLLINTSYVSR